MSYTLGILDQSPIIEDATNEQALQNTVALTQKAEQLGYSRFWVSEHHNTDTLAGTSPEVLVSYLLAKTKTINIGSGASCCSIIAHLRWQKIFMCSHRWSLEEST